MIRVHFGRAIVSLPLAVALLAAADQLPAVGPASLPGEQAPQQVPGAFRARITTVPVDVRVLDKNGRPVTDLRRDEFVILEDRVLQEITQFLTQALTASTPAAGGPERRKAPGPEISAQNKRIFLFVLGRGRLQYPGSNVDAMIDFVRKRLLPQDQVGILAFNRASDFTTDHEKIAQLMDRFKTRHERIDTDISHHFSGLQAVYGSREIPKRIQDAIDDVFRLDGAPAFRSLPPGQITDGPGIAKDNRRDVDVLVRGELAAAKKAGGGTTMDVMAESEAELVAGDMSFDEFAFVRLRSMQDLTSIYTGIEYLRFLEGEKHLVYVSERGLSLPRLENDKSIAALANDARVVIDPIYTGGVVGPRPPTSTQSFAVASPSMVFSQGSAVATNRLIADFTGGQATAYRSAAQALERIDQATRFSYLLGYQPSNPDWNGAYRRIEVRVTRPGVTVSYRHGYYARQQLVPFDRKEFLTYSRIVAAGNHPELIRDIEVTVEAGLEKPAVSSDKPGTAGQAGVMVVRGAVSPARMTMTQKGDMRAGSIEIAIFCGGNRGEVVGQAWNRIDLEMTPEAYDRFMQKGITYDTRIPISGPVTAVKVVAYNPEADLVGTAVTRVR